MVKWATPAGPAEIGRLWLFTQFAEPKNHDNVMERLSEGPTDLVIMLNDSPTHDPEWGVKFGWKFTEALTNAALGAGKRVHWCLWINPKERFVKEASRDLRKALKRNHRVSSTIFDLEWEYRDGVDDHTAFVARVVAPAFHKWPVPIGITSFAMMPVEVKPICLWAAEEANGFGMPQAYSQDQGKEGQKSTLMVPSEIVRIAYKRWQPFFGNKIVMLLNAWSPASEMMPGRYFDSRGDKKWHGKKWGVRESLEVALKRSSSLGLTDAGLWSEEALSRKTGSTPRKKALAAAAKTRRDYISTLRPTGHGQAVSDKADWVVPLAVGAGITGLVLAGAAYAAKTRK